MQYTRSKGEHHYETFEGTPEEIAKLINAIDKKPKKHPFDPPPLINPGPISPGVGIGSLGLSISELLSSSVTKRQNESSELRGGEN